MSAGPFSIIESRWWDEGNHSVRSVFEVIASIHYNNPSAYFYDMYSEKYSLAVTLSTRCTDFSTKVIYLATHGDEVSIGNGTFSISRTELRNMLCAANAKGQVNGLYLGTCCTGNSDTAAYILNGTANLGWIAGYSEEVDWIDGSAIDMVFFHRLAQEYLKNKSRRVKSSDIAMAKTAATELNKLIPGSHSKYGFNIFFYDGYNVTSMFG